MSAKFEQMTDPWGPFLKVVIVENLSTMIQDRVILIVRGYGISAPPPPAPAPAEYRQIQPLNNFLLLSWVYLIIVHILLVTNFTAQVVPKFYFFIK